MLRTPAVAGALLFVLIAVPAAAQQETLEVTFDLAQYSHPGSWSFSRGCTHTPATGRNNYVHLTVVWLEDMNGNYVTTLHRWGRSYLFDLKAWSTAAGAGLDGVTSATPTSDGSDAGPSMVFRNFTTGVRNISSLPDGTYRVRFESTQCELADGFRSPPNPNPFAGGTAFGPTAMFTFTKGRANQSNALLGSTAPFNNVRVNYVVPAGNAPPGVFAGPDQWKMPSVTPSEATATLNGVVTDPAGTPTLAWTQTGSKPAGLTAAIASAASATTNVTFTQAGVYTFRLTATDSGGLASFDEVTVYVNAKLLNPAGDAEVASGNATTPMGIIENAGPWTWANGPDTGNRARAYLRFDLTSIPTQVTFAQLRLRPAEQTPNPTLKHDFFILTDAQDDWNGVANTSTDYEATTTWNNQVVTNGLASSLMGTQLAGSANHLQCELRHAFSDPALNPGQAATTCPARMDVDLNLANINTHDTNKTWSFFMAPNPAAVGNGLGLGSDENAVSMQLLVVQFWQSGANAPPVAVPGTYAVVKDQTPPLGTETVLLNASASTDDGAIVTYEWRENGVLLGSSTTPTFSASLALGIHTLELTVIDGGGLSAKATTTVTVEDRFEPNHTRQTAATVMGSVPSLFASAANPAGDWYGVDLVAGSTLAVTVTMTGGNLDVRLYDPAGTQVAAAATAGLTETAMTTATAAGKYFIQVEAVGGVAGASRYAMTINASNAMTVTLNPTSGVENAGTIAGAGTVTLPAAATAPVTVNLTASLPAQLGFVATPITIPMGQTSATFGITLVNDPPGVPNASRFVTITATAMGFNPGSAMFEILDDEAALFVSWDKAAETVSEAGGPTVQLKAVLSASTAGTVTVPFTLTGTATKGSDYSTPIAAGQVTISGGTTATYLISITDDMIADPDETVIVTMGTPTGAAASGTTTYTLTIGDDDGAGPDGGTGGAGGGGGGADPTRGVCGCSAGTAGWLFGLMGVAFALRRRRSSVG